MAAPASSKITDASVKATLQKFTGFGLDSVPKDKYTFPKEGITTFIQALNEYEKTRTIDQPFAESATFFQSDEVDKALDQWMDYFFCNEVNRVVTFKNSFKVPAGPPTKATPQKWPHTSHTTLIGKFEKSNRPDLGAWTEHCHTYAQLYLPYMYALNLSNNPFFSKEFEKIQEDAAGVHKDRSSAKSVAHMTRKVKSTKDLLNESSYIQWDSKKVKSAPSGFAELFENLKELSYSILSTVPDITFVYKKLDNPKVSALDRHTDFVTMIQTCFTQYNEVCAYTLRDRVHYAYCESSISQAIENYYNNLAKTYETLSKIEYYYRNPNIEKTTTGEKRTYNQSNAGGHNVVLEIATADSDKVKLDFALVELTRVINAPYIATEMCLGIL